MFKSENLKALRAEFESIALANPPDSDVREIYLDAVKEITLILKSLKFE